MIDQAEALRRLMKARAEAAPARPARTLVFTSGKGGVGTSNLALNLAIALAGRGAKVLLIDADLGLANLDLLCGLAPARDLGEVLLSGRPLADAITDGPDGVRLLAGAHGTRSAADLLAEAPDRLADELRDLESGVDFLLIDAGSGLNPSIAALAELADAAVVVTTPEPTSIADACAAMRWLAPVAPLRLAVTQAHSKAEAREYLDRLAATGRQFLGVAASPLGFVRSNSCVARAVRSREPFLTSHPRSAASRDVRRIAAALLAERDPTPRAGLFAKLLAYRGGRREAG